MPYERVRFDRNDGIAVVVVVVVVFLDIDYLAIAVLLLKIILVLLLARAWLQHFSSTCFLIKMMILRGSENL